MKCTSNTAGQRRPGNRKRRNVAAMRRQQKKRQRTLIISLILALVLVCVAAVFIWIRIDSSRTYVSSYEQENYNTSVSVGSLFAQNLCVSTEDVALDGFSGDSTLSAAGLFDLDNSTVIYADRIHEQIYPASTTKILTAIVALKYGNLDDIVTVSQNAITFDVDGVSVCGLEAGDQLTLYDLLCGLLLSSGNDAANVIAEHISGDIDSFVELMNTEAKAIGATNTNFVNPHGLHEDNHYTTAYDLYLMFNEALTYDTFTEIISMDSYTASITSTDGTTRTDIWEPTNYYSAGLVDMPEGVTVIGGKTGTEDLAGSCVILYSKNTDGSPYISIIMGADDKTILYDDMTALLSAGVAGNTEGQ